MKRKGDLYYKIYNIENLRLADKKARKGKAFQKGVIEHDKNKENNILKLHYMLRNKTYKTSEYFNYTINDGKVREISRLPYFPDRIAHHAIANIIEPILRSTFTADTYNAIKEKGIHKLSSAIQTTLKNNLKLNYCLKLDIRKFYPSVNNIILKNLIRKKIKDTNTLNLLDEIIDSSVGLPLGNYLSQPFANFYLTYFDHWLKEKCKVNHVFRYCDDICVLSDNKQDLHILLMKIKIYLKTELKLDVKNNHQVFPINTRAIDIVGYCIKRTHVRLRKTIKKRFASKLARRINNASIASYAGWLKHCNGKHLTKKLLNGKINTETSPSNE